MNKRTIALVVIASCFLAFASMYINGRLSTCDEYRNTTTKIRGDCVTYYKKQAANGSGNAMMALSENAQELNNSEEADKWRMAAAKAGNIGAISDLCYLYNRKNIKVNPATFELWIKKNSQTKALQDSQISALIYLYVGACPGQENPGRAADLFFPYTGHDDLLLLFYEKYRNQTNFMESKEQRLNISSLFLRCATNTENSAYLRNSCQSIINQRASSDQKPKKSRH